MVSEPKQQSQKPPMAAINIDTLLEDGKLLRVLSPEIRARIERVLPAHTETQQFIIESDGQLYLSFISITDPSQRQQMVRLIQRFQSGEQVDLASLPAALQQLLQPELTQFGRLLGAVFLGSFVGIGTAILALAIGTLLLNVLPVLGVLGGSEPDTVSLTAIIFVVFGVLGWLVGSFVAWRRLQTRPDESTSQKIWQWLDRQVP